MGPNKRKLGPKPKQESAEAKEREQDTIREINKVLDQKEVDLAQLRKLAAARGLVNNEIRARVWPLLLGVKRSIDVYDGHKVGKHRDSSVVDVDVQRSLWAWTEGWSDAQRKEKRQELRFVLDATVCAQGGTIFYYQGLHDIASVLLLVMGDRTAYQTLTHLSLCQLRDCTRSTLDAVLELLGLLMPILREADGEVHDQLAAAEVPPFFALGWFITWFAHSVDNLQHVSRLFDLFMAAHPLMPLYVTAVVIKGARKQVLACEPDPAELHRLLTNLPVLGQLSADELCQQAASLFKQSPPSKLISTARLQFICSTEAEAEIKDEHWHVDDQPQAPGTVPKYPLHFWKHFFMGPATRRKGVLLTMALAGSVVVTMAVAASQHQLASQLYSMAL